MKMLKKLAALILAATMVLVLFTACGDGGGTGTREPEKEAKAFATFSKNDRVAADARVNDPQLQAVAEKHLDEDLQAKVDFFGAKFFGKVHVDGKEEENLTITVTAKYEYGPLVSGILSEIEKELGKELPGTNINVDGKGSWTKIPSTESSALSFSKSANNSASEVSAGSFSNLEVMPTSEHALILLRT